jgi:hypothetical protein
MRDRDRRSIKAFMEEEAKLYAAEQEEKQKPIREATEQLQQTHRELYALQREKISKGVDDEIFVDPATLGYELPQSEADTFNVSECKKFIASHPEYNNSDANNRTVIDYLTRNGVQIFSALTLEKAVQRLQEYRLLEARPAPVQPKPIPHEPLITFDTPEQTEKQNYQVGIDLNTGEEREYSLYEINKMSSDEYRKIFRVTKAQLNPSGRNW